MIWYSKFVSKFGFHRYKNIQMYLVNIRWSFYQNMNLLNLIILTIAWFSSLTNFHKRKVTSIFAFTVISIKSNTIFIIYCFIHSVDALAPVSHQTQTTFTNTICNVLPISPWYIYWKMNTVLVNKAIVDFWKAVWRQME